MNIGSCPAQLPLGDALEPAPRADNPGAGCC